MQSLLIQSAMIFLMTSKNSSYPGFPTIWNEFTVYKSSCKCSVQLTSSIKSNSNHLSPSADSFGITYTFNKFLIFANVAVERSTRTLTGYSINRKKSRKFCHWMKYIILTRFWAHNFRFTYTKSFGLQIFWHSEMHMQRFWISFIKAANNFLSILQFALARSSLRAF